jgi:hypothetical protein
VENAESSIRDALKHMQRCVAGEDPQRATLGLGASIGFDIEGVGRARKTPPTAAFLHGLRKLPKHCNTSGVGGSERAVDGLRKS